MTALTRKQVLFGAGAAFLATGAGFRTLAASPYLTQVNPRWVVSESEAIAWHKMKVEKGPALAGTASWHQFLGLLEQKLKEYGCVDVARSAWNFKRLETSTWPDDSKWSLVSDNRRIPLSNYGANCGLTGPAGVTAELVVWDAQTKPDVAGKIVVYRPTPRADVRDLFSNGDYEAMTPFDSWPTEGRPVTQALDGTNSIASEVWDDMTATSTFIRDIAPAKPAGVVFAMNLNKAATAGLYTFAVPEHYGFPSVYVDRSTGDGVLADAKAGKRATIRVEGEHVQSETYQLIAYLPGRDYGTDRDQQIQLRTHTDGPSISQDDGAFGLLGVVKYMANVPKQDRPRTLFIEMDCRHFMPGAERAWDKEDYFVKYPRARDKVVAMVAMEHLGQIEYVNAGEELRPSGRSMQTWLYASPDKGMLDFALKAARDNNLRSVIIRSPGRPGVHGKSQGPWYGMSGGGQYLGLPTYGVQGDLGAYWAHAARMEQFDARSFTRQVATFAQLTGFLMSSQLPKVPTAVRGPPPANLR